jgi:nicotinamidase/pyrazinamidase
MSERTALLVVDIQPDFLPGGALPVAQGDTIIPGIRRLLDSRRFGLCVATQDWHPPGHVSFASSHSGTRPFEVVELYGREQILWPDHCVQGTTGAVLHASLPLDRMAAIVRKGTDPLVDSYSAFRNNWDRDGRRPATGLAGYLRELGVDEVVLCGLARDFCVAWSAEDAVNAGFVTRIVWDLTRSVMTQNDERLRASLVSRGVEIVVSDDVDD